MTLPKIFPATSVVSSISLLALAISFSACVPVDPQAPATEPRLNFATNTADGSGEVLKFWSSTTQQVTETSITSYNANMGIVPVSGQPNGPTLLYFTGTSNFLTQIGNYYTAEENEAGQYVRRHIKSYSDERTDPVWSPDGNYLAWEQTGRLLVAPTGGAATRVGASSTLFNWSPDSRKIIYLSLTTDALTANVYDVTSGQNIQVFSEAAPAQNSMKFTWLSDNRHVVISASKHFLIDSTLPAPTAYQEIGANEGDIIPSPANNRFVLVSGEPYVTSTRTYSLAFADGRASVPLADAFGQTAPRWSASGNQLYIVTDAGNDNVLDIITTNADGQLQQSTATGVPALRYGYDNNFTQVYNSPKNDKFAFVHLNDDAGTLQLTVVDEPSGNIHGFDPVAGFGIEASWSPDGRYLAWGTPDDDQYLYDSNSASVVSRLMNTDANRLGLRLGAWSSDSKHIATCRDSNPYSCLVTVITVNAGTLTYTALPDIADNDLVWTGK